MSDDFTPSPCPILDLGVRLEKGDPNDPWRRMPLLFQTAKGVFGAGMFNHDGQTRKRIEARIGHYCKCTRETHGACTLQRSKLCRGAITEEVQRAAFAPKGQEHAYMQAGITRLLRSERHHADLKATRVAVAGVSESRPWGRDLAMPPICKEIPNADA